MQSFHLLDAPGGARTVLLSRHGRTWMNESGIIQGWGSSSLSGTGRREVDAVRGWWEGREVGLVASSPLLRARETATLLFGRVDELDAGLAEVALPSLEGLDVATARRNGQVLGADGWLHPGRDGTVAEAPGAVLARAVGALRRLAALAGPGGVCAAFSHGDVLRQVVSSGTGADPGPVANLAVVEVMVDPAVGWEVVAVHDPVGATS